MAKKKSNKITLNVQLPRDLHEQFKTFAKAKGEPMRFFVQNLVKDLLKFNSDVAVVKQMQDDLNKVRLEWSKELLESELQKARTQGVEL